jgi:hypothetical protein
MQLARHPQPPGHVCNIKHLQLPQLALALQGGNLTAQVLQRQQEDSQCEFRINI